MQTARKIDRLEKNGLKDFLGSPEGVRRLCKEYFYDDEGNDLWLTDYQAKIVFHLIHKSPKRILMWATRRAGKSYALSVGAILNAVFSPGEKIRVIGPIQKKSKIIMENIQEFITHDDDIIRTVSDRKGKVEPKKLKDELSKTRITFENGNEISILSANITSRRSGVLGRGGTLIIVDEAERIPANVIRNDILPMVGEKSNAQVVLVSNPTMPGNRGFMHEKKVEKDNRWTQIKIGWQKAVDQGRISLDTVKEAKKNLTKGEFKRWYKSEYPSEIEGGLLEGDWVTEAVKTDLDLPDEYESSYGLDVAEAGRDKTVLMRSRRWKEGQKYLKVGDIHSWNTSDTMNATERVDSLLNNAKINVDAIGIGKGVGDRLKEKGHDVDLIKVSRKPKTQSDRFDSRKSELYWTLRKQFEEGVVDLPNNQKLQSQLLSMNYEFSPSGKIRIVDPSRSPDYADSLVLTLASMVSKKAGAVSVDWT